MQNIIKKHGHNKRNLFSFLLVGMQYIFEEAVVMENRLVMGEKSQISTAISIKHAYNKHYDREKYLDVRTDDCTGPRF